MSTVAIFILVICVAAASFSLGFGITSHVYDKQHLQDLADAFARGWLEARAAPLMSIEEWRKANPIRTTTGGGS